MKRIEMYELAGATGKGLASETDNVKISLAIAQAAQANKVAGEDFQQFQQYATAARNVYRQLAGQLLPSELAAQRAEKVATGASRIQNNKATGASPLPDKTATGASQLPSETATGASPLRDMPAEG